MPTENAYSGICCKSTFGSELVVSACQLTSPKKLHTDKCSPLFYFRPRTKALYLLMTIDIQLSTIGNWERFPGTKINEFKVYTVLIR